MSKREFKVGNLVRIRSWEDMEKEFGLDERGCIDLDRFTVFSKPMKHLCGELANINGFDGRDVYLDFLEKSVDRNYNWDYTIDMIEHVEETPYKFVKCVLYYDGFTVGKVYEIFVICGDNIVCDDDGDNRDIDIIMNNHPKVFKNVGSESHKREADSTPYWQNVCEIQRKQAEKGFKKYGTSLEGNTELSPMDRITYLQEELIDGLMYCEHIKAMLDNTTNAFANDSDEYQKACLRTASLETNSDMLLNGALGLCGESGEVADHIKKSAFQGHTLDKDKLINELGDVAWYLATTAHALGVNLSEVFQRNVDKLKSRYPDGFDKEHSLNRQEEK